MTDKTALTSPRGIGGWLIPLGLMMFGMLLFYLRAAVLAPDLFMVFINLIWIALIAFLLFIFLMRHEAFPRTFTGFYWTVSLLLWSDLWIGTTTLEKPLIMTLITIGWTCYLLRSERVKRTFVFKNFSRNWDPENPVSENGA